MDGLDTKAQGAHGTGRPVMTTGWSPREEV
jgi:hypothetical protein